MSTSVELAGFVAWVVAAFVWASVPLEVVTGLVVLGLVLLFVGLVLDDAHTAVLKVEARILGPGRARWQAWRKTRAEAKAAEKAAQPTA